MTPLQTGVSHESEWTIFTKKTLCQCLHANSFISYNFTPLQEKYSMACNGRPWPKLRNRRETLFFPKISKLKLTKLLTVAWVVNTLLKTPANFSTLDWQGSRIIDGFDITRKVGTYLAVTYGVEDVHWTIKLCVEHIFKYFNKEWRFVLGFHWLYLFIFHKCPTLI